MPDPTETREGEYSRFRERVMERLSDLSTIISRLEYEVTALAKDLGHVAEDVSTELMHPHEGAVVRLRHLERDVMSLDEALARQLREDLIGRIAAHDTNAVALVTRILALEKARDAKEETRKWLRRDIVGIGVMLVVTAVLTGIITAQIVK